MASVSLTSDTLRGKRSKPYVKLVLVCAVAALCLLGIWLWRVFSSEPAVYVVGDSITALE